MYGLERSHAAHHACFSRVHIGSSSHPLGDLGIADRVPPARAQLWALQNNGSAPL